MPRPTRIEILLPELRAYAHSLCRTATEVDDLVQDTVERALRSPQRPRAMRSLRPWMFRVMRNVHLDELRRRRVRMEYSSREKRLYDDPGAAADQPRDVLTRLAFERLPPEKREILFLVDIAGLKYAEAAEVLGVAHGTVMSRVSRARYALRLEIAGDGETDEKARRE